jgi:hypothetical protein
MLTKRGSTTVVISVSTVALIIGVICLSAAPRTLSRREVYELPQGAVTAVHASVEDAFALPTVSQRQAVVEGGTFGGIVLAAEGVPNVLPGLRARWRAGSCLLWTYQFAPARVVHSTQFLGDDRLVVEGRFDNSGKLYYCFIPKRFADVREVFTCKELQSE